MRTWSICWPISTSRSPCLPPFASTSSAGVWAAEVSQPSSRNARGGVSRAQRAVVALGLRREAAAFGGGHETSIYRRAAPVGKVERAFLIIQKRLRVSFGLFLRHSKSCAL